ncbi:MAG: ParA family protein [Anaerolineae bacterium]
MSVIAVVNQKGGVGKTTTAVNLAHGLSHKMNQNGGGRILLIDMDPQGNCATALGVKPGQRCISQLLTGQRSLKEVIIQDTSRANGGTGRKGLFLIPSSERLVEATEELLIRDFQSHRRRRENESLDNILSQRLGSFRNAFDFTVIDCPPSLGTLTEAVYEFSDRAIVPVRTAMLDATGAAQHTRMINELQEAGLDISVSLILPTFYEPRQILAQQVLRDLAVKYGRNRIAHPIVQSVIVQQAQAAGGQTLFEYEPADGRAPTVAYTKLVERVYNER